MSLKNNWIKEDTFRISQEHLFKRYQTALLFLEKYRGWVASDNGCYEATADTIRPKPISFRIVPKPYITTSLDRIVYNRLTHQWACKAFSKPLDSLRIYESKNLSEPSEQTRLIGKYVSQAVDSVNGWRTRNQSYETDKVSSILKKFPTDENSARAILFELPTGRTIRAHIPILSSDMQANWDSLKYNPSQIIFDASSADEAIIFFNKQDSIEQVWWGGWEKD